MTQRSIQNNEFNIANDTHELMSTVKDLVAIKGSLQVQVEEVSATNQELNKVNHANEEKVAIILDEDERTRHGGEKLESNKMIIEAKEVSCQNEEIQAKMEEIKKCAEKSAVQSTEDLAVAVGLQQQLPKQQSLTQHQLKPLQPVVMHSSDDDFAPEFMKLRLRMSSSAHTPRLGRVAAMIAAREKVKGAQLDNDPKTKLAERHRRADEGIIDDTADKELEFDSVRSNNNGSGGTVNLFASRYDEEEVENQVEINHQPTKHAILNTHVVNDVLAAKNACNRTQYRARAHRRAKGSRIVPKPLYTE